MFDDLSEIIAQARNDILRQVEQGINAALKRNGFDTSDYEALKKHNPEIKEYPSGEKQYWIDGRCIFRWTETIDLIDNSK